MRSRSALLLAVGLMLLVIAALPVLPQRPVRAQASAQPTFLPLVRGSGTLSLPYADGPGTADRTTVAPTGTDDFASATFSLWIPGGVPVVRGLIVYAPGCGASSLTDSPSSTRASLARTWHLGFLGMQFTDKAGGKFCGWSRISSGSPAALARALAAFSTRFSRPELVNAPCLFFGVSGGSGWSSAMALQYPARTYAVFARGFGPGGALPDAARGVPMLLNGKPDGSYGTEAAFTNCRSQGGHCALNLDPGGEPSLGKQWDSLALPYFDSILRQRMPVEAPISGPVTLRPADERQAWLGIRAGVTIVPAAGYSGDALSASWLPDAAFARRWQDYNAHGTLSPWTP